MGARRIAKGVAFLGLLALLSGPVWQFRNQPLFGADYDDGVYFSAAKALAAGEGYRMPGFPGQPWEVKFPPVYPLYLSLAWRVQPSFPASLAVASVFQAGLLPVFLALLLLTLQGLGFVWRRSVLIAALMVTPIAFTEVATMLFSEILFLCFLLASIVAGERALSSRRPWLWVAAAGLLAGAAYLTRTAGLPLLVAAPIFYCLRRRPKLAVGFLACALPAAAGWHLWTSAHTVSASEGYFQEYARALHGTSFAANVQAQIIALSSASAENLITGISAALRGFPLFPILLLAVAGMVRLVRRRQWPLLLVFTALYLTMLLCWWYHDLARLILPAWPGLLAGIATEVDHFISLVRPVAAGRQLRWTVVAIAAAVVLWNEHAAWRSVSAAVAASRAQAPSEQQAFNWIRAHAGPGDVVLAWKDARTWFLTGVPSSNELFSEVTDSRPLAPIPARYRRGLLLLVGSELQGSDDQSAQATLAKVGNAVPGAQLAWSTPTALIYTVPLNHAGD